jgi:RNA-directed DNA polymerase
MKPRSSDNDPRLRDKTSELRENLFSFKNLYTAYLRCRKNKRTTDHAAKFEMNLESELLKLSDELKGHRYQPSPSVCFAISDPKLREVWAADFRDRVVHHLLVSHLEPVWERIFVFHSYACRQNKGAHKAIRHLRKTVTPDLFFLQADIRSFFVTIDKSILFSLIKKRINNPELLWLAEKIIFHDPTMSHILKGDSELLRSVPMHKSLFGKARIGLPIGNLTSQFFANVYLNELDQFAKHTLKCPHYFRYMDDFLLFSHSKEQLIVWRDRIKSFVETELHLKLHPKKQILQSVTKGINFCGYIVKPDYTLIRRRTVRKLKDRLWRFNRKISDTLKQNGIDDTGLFYDRFSIFDSEETKNDFRRIFSSINSTYGLFKHADCFNLRKTLYKKHFGILRIYLDPVNRDYVYFVWKEH